MNFAITGVAGYIAPRHLKAIKETGNALVAATDPHDSVGIMDRYFFDTSFFREFERFDRHIENRRRGPEDGRVNYVSICSPNYLHDAHIRFALRIGADAICEKPLVINPWNAEALAELEAESGNRIYTVLQLRLHPAVIALKEKFATNPGTTKHKISLDYITSRGKWYLYSWKGNAEQSGGLVTNIGVHFLDMLLWIFGAVQESVVHVSDPMRTSGHLELERAEVDWSLSICGDDLPQDAVERGLSTFRSIQVDGEEVEFSTGFTDLHTRVYEEILAGRGYGISDAMPAVQLVHDIRQNAPK